MMLVNPQHIVKYSLLITMIILLMSCNDNPVNPEPRIWEPAINEGDKPDFTHMIGVEADYTYLASEPLDASIPGATSAKSIIDQADGGTLYFQNSRKYQIHWDFAIAHLSGNGKPIVPSLAQFNSTEYYNPNRRFILGAITRYEGPGVWTYEIAPYDNASAEMIEMAFAKIKDNTYFGESLFFHPTSKAIEIEAGKLSNNVPVITTKELLGDITYQPLNLGTSMGLIAFYSSDDLKDQIPYFREIVVLDAVPNEISIVMGIITNDFQTPLSHINVLSQNRGTPNMALIDSYNDSTLRSLEGKWIELTVSPMDYSIREVTQAEADEWWEANQSEPIDIEMMDLSVTDIRDEQDILNMADVDLAEALSRAIPAFGGKAAHYGALALIGDDVPHPIAFAIPVYYYHQFMTDNGLWTAVEEMLTNLNFQNNIEVRRDMLSRLRNQIEDAPIDSDFITEVETKILDGFNSGIYPSTRFRFRSSTNAEDVAGFNGAGLYRSKSGDPNDPSDPVEEAIIKVWASLWSDRAYEEREFYSINHRNIGMALLCHRSFPDENANGVAITNNIYDISGLEPAFYINVQEGEESVVFPEAGVTTDQIIYYFDLPNQPAVYIQHSNLIPEGETVLTDRELHELGSALSALHSYFYPVYGNNGGFYGMDTEFKFDENPVTGQMQLYFKQARPYPGWSQQ
jgi:hypothetical protein